MHENRVELKDRFAWYEKLLMRGGFAALVAIGTLAIYWHSLPAAGGYLLFVAVGGLAVIYDSLCVYCPYPFEHEDCLFFPAPLLTRVSAQRVGAISPLRKLISAVAFLGIVAIPQPWLWGQWPWFAAFWALAAAGAVFIPFHFCRRCRHRRCPMNLVRLQTRN